MKNGMCYFYKVSEIANKYKEINKAKNEIVKSSMCVAKCVHQ